MANWCNTWLNFQGNVETLKAEIKAAIDRESTYHEGQMFGDVESVDGYFFETAIVGESDTDVSITYETKWSPNLESISAICKRFNVTAEVEYEELGMEILGKAIVEADGTIISHDVPQEVFDRIEYNEDGDYYVDTLTGMTNECQQDLIDIIYPL
jgi:hypothetical protein